MTQNTSHRIGFKFWLNLRKEDEAAIADQVEMLKNERSFTQTIRDGIRLICDLKNGKLDVLFELFPWVRAEFMEYMRDLAPASTTPTPQIAQPSAQQAYADQTWLNAEQERIEAERKWHEKRMQDAEQALAAERKKIEKERSQTQNAIQEQLERLEKLLLQQGNQPITGGAGGNPAQNSSGLQALNVPTFSTPTY
ncbi:MAG: hypothetical protein WBC91_18250, partial [Phototrophicaceae bacterium]